MGAKTVFYKTYGPEATKAARRALKRAAKRRGGKYEPYNFNYGRKYPVPEGFDPRGPKER